MKKLTLLFISILLLGSSCNQEIQKTEAVIAPSPDAGTGIHNGDIGLKVWGPNNRITFSIGKSDVWDRRRFQQEPLLTLADLKEMSTHENAFMISDENHPDGSPMRHYQSYAAYDFPCPKPVGQLIMGLPGKAEDWTVHVSEDDIPGVLNIDASMGEQLLELRVYIHATQNLIVFEGNASRAINDLWLRIYRHKDVNEVGFAHLGTTSKYISEIYDYSKDIGNGPIDPPTAENSEEIGWITQEFPGEQTFPEGFRYTYAAITSIKGAKLKTVQGKKGLGTPALSPNGLWSPSNYVVPDYLPINETTGAAVTYTFPTVEGQFQVLATVITSTDAAATMPLAESRLKDALSESPSERFDQHLAGTKDPYYPFLTRKEGGYYGAVPQATWAYSSTNSFSTKPGPWTDFYCAWDATPWHGDFHFDEQQYSRHIFIMKEEKQLEPYFQLIEKMLPLAQIYAEEVYDLPGCAYPIVYYPIKTDRIFNANIVWEQIMEIAALNIKPFWEHYLYTGDKEFLANRTFQLLREGARFYASFVTLEEDGYYHVVPTASPEHWGLTKDFERNKDSQSSLTLIRYHLNAAYQAAKILGLEEEDRDNWKHIADNMAPFPTYDTKAGPIFVDVLGAPPITYNISVPLTAIYWGDEITPDSPEEILEIAWRTIDSIDARNYVPLARCLLGDYMEGSNLGPENLLQSQAGWDMLRKKGGWIRIFPAVPENYTGSFKDYRATGAFEVSANSENGIINGLTIYSHDGYACQLVNPWPGREIIVHEEGKSGRGLRLRGSHCTFTTRSGAMYQIEPVEN